MFDGYLAQRYTGTDLEQAERCQVGEACAAWLFRQGLMVYAPIPSWHHIARAHHINGDYVTFAALNRAGIEACREFWILDYDEPGKSAGVQDERQIAKDAGKIDRLIGIYLGVAASGPHIFYWLGEAPFQTLQKRNRRQPGHPAICPGRA